MNPKPASQSPDHEQKQTDIESGIRTLNSEAEGLSALARTLDRRFSEAVAAIHDMKKDRRGRLIVAGIGKSGHVAKKITATLASTGTPSHFVHPGEASHGDLGMITECDIVLLLSNGGESAELSDLIHYTRRFGITLIAMTSNPDSTLAKHSDIQLIMPKMPEACPNGLAPTTSTTMMMALGDALAVALLERTGLTAEQFRVFHPGGKLGQRLRKVSEIMQPLEKLPLAREADTMDKVLLVMTEKNLGAVMIVDERAQLLGIITDGDLRRHMGPSLLTKTAGELMTRNPKAIEADLLAAEAVDLMLNGFKSAITCLAVMEEGRFCGLIRMQDCLQAGIA
ncbi:MAG: KpsF/GutQ family sugar-phosphate isomerase [Micavibrio aeruginosavorus]|uniref:KpsF/GutQ family sugar-phosphate isomerase n=1 Tax=Micavibrio aeruginosavorus TaxID=349221 RepID=A0A7T5R2B6_9BACT|nr:MAG: KpsF/GutQ family sugar-phosphate isomerase [Micavibrio aeruginosavorus]